MSDILLCPYCKTYLDKTINPNECPQCKESLVGIDVGTSSQSRSKETGEKDVLSSVDVSQKDDIRCPTCNDLVSTRYRPVTCYKCGQVDPSVLPNNSSSEMYVVNVYGGIGRLSYFVGFLGLAVLISIINSIFTVGLRIQSGPPGMVSWIMLGASLYLVAMRL